MTAETAPGVGFERLPVTRERVDMRGERDECRERERAKRDEDPKQVHDRYSQRRMVGS
jgi:hypothetical protein